MGDEIDGLDVIRQAIDWKTAQHLNHVERAQIVLTVRPHGGTSLG
jgi:hypothetical protein